MFCPNCGKQIDDDSLFCEFCGTKITSEVSNNVKPIAQETTAPKPEEVKNVNQTQEIKPQPQPQINPTRKKMPAYAIALICIGSAILTFGIVACIFVFSGTSIKMLEDDSFYSSGYNGYGSLEANFEDYFLSKVEDEYEILEAEYGSTCSLINILSSNKCSKLSNKITFLKMGDESIKVYYETNNDKPLDKLSNGDTVTVTIDYNKEYFRKAGYRLSSVKKKYKIEGLPEPQVIDVLSNVNLEWKSDGYSFYLEVEPSEGCPVDIVPCEITEPDENGDVVVTIDLYELSEKYGYVVSEDNLSKTFHVGSTPERIDYISDSNRSKVKKLAVSVLYDNYVGKCSDDLYGGNNGKEKIIFPTVDDITSISAYNGTVNVTFTISTEKGNKYRKSIQFEAYIDSNGDAQCATEYDEEEIESHGCSVSYGTWPEHEPNS